MPVFWSSSRSVNWLVCPDGSVLGPRRQPRHVIGHSIWT